MNTALFTAPGKKELRAHYLEERKILLKNDESKKALDAEIQTRLIITPAYRRADTVLIYAARDFEVDTAMIIRAALANHKTVALPVCMPDGSLTFRRVRSLGELVPGRYGILTPPDGAEQVSATADTLCVCPCLCCDMQGHRLGFGGGYYDRFLADFAGTSAALCYGDGLIPAFDTAPYDVPVDVIVTDSFIRYTNSCNNKEHYDE